MHVHTHFATIHYSGFHVYVIGMTMPQFLAMRYHKWWRPLLDISEVNRQYHISHSLGHILHSLGISQYIGCTREAQIRPQICSHISQIQYITVNYIKKRKGSVKISTTIYKTCVSFHFYLRRESSAGWGGSSIRED